MIILGIDVGRINLGVCAVDDDRRIVRWALWESEGSRATHLWDCLRANATDDFLQGVTQVVIEQQPSKNPTMVRIMNYLEFFFVSRGFPVALQDSKHKLLYASTMPQFPEDSTDREWTYRHRKTLAVQTVAKYVRETDQPLATVFERSKKKDDLADALLHALAYGSFGKVAPPPPAAASASAKKKVVARAPTDKQRRTGKLSPSNVKFLLRGCVGEEDVGRRLASDSQLARALKKHFGTVAGFRKAIA